jgi:hypothetical protein
MYDASTRAKLGSSHVEPHDFSSARAWAIHLLRGAPAPFAPPAMFHRDSPRTDARRDDRRLRCSAERRGATRHGGQGAGARADPRSHRAEATRTDTEPGARAGAARIRRTHRRLQRDRNRAAHPRVTLASLRRAAPPPTPRAHWAGAAASPFRSAWAFRAASGMTRSSKRAMGERNGNTSATPTQLKII